MWSRVTAALWRRPWARATMLLTPPLAWFVLIYLAALAVLLVTAFWQINPFTTNIERIWSLDNLRMIVTSPAYRDIILRTVGMAAAVTVTDAVVAFPFAYFMARIASGRTRTFLFMAILLPLWASYLAKVLVRIAAIMSRALAFAAGDGWGRGRGSRDGDLAIPPRRRSPDRGVWPRWRMVACPLPAAPVLAPLPLAHRWPAGPEQHRRASAGAATVQPRDVRRRMNAITRRGKAPRRSPEATRAANDPPVP